MPPPPDESGGYRHFAPFGAKKFDLDTDELQRISSVIYWVHPANIE